MSLETQIDESEAFFDFHWNVGENDEGTAEDIRSLKDLPIRNPRHFGIEAASWDDTLLDSFLQVFHHFSESNILWKHFDLLSLDNADHPFLQRLLFRANSLGLFEEMTLAFFASTRGIDDSPEEFVLSGIDLNQRLMILDIDVCVGAISVGDFHALNRLLQSSECLKELRFSGMTNINDELLCEGLAANTTLERLSFDCTSCEASDRSTANIFSTLARHPCLQELVVAASVQFGDLSSIAIQTLLASTVTLQRLSLKNANAYGKLNSEWILEGLRCNTSLRVWETFNALQGNLRLATFLKVLPQCTSLERIVLRETSMTREDLESVQRLDHDHNKELELCRPIELKLARHTINSLSTTVKEIVQCHSKLRLDTDEHQFGAGGGSSSRRRVLEHLCDLNWHGRYLLEESPTTMVSSPPGLWSLILERANAKPSVLYEFLKGPALAARNDWAYS